MKHAAHGRQLPQIVKLCQDKRKKASAKTFRMHEANFPVEPPPPPVYMSAAQFSQPALSNQR